MRPTDSLLPIAHKFLTENRDVLTHDVNNLCEATTAIMQPDTANGLETRCTSFRTLRATPTCLSPQPRQR